MTCCTEQKWPALPVRNAASVPTSEVAVLIIVHSRLIVSTLEFLAALLSCSAALPEKSRSRFVWGKKVGRYISRERGRTI